MGKTMADDISNKTLLGRINIEGTVAVLIFTFGIGGTWYSLAGDVDKNKEAVEQVRRDQAEISRDVSAIQQDIAGIKASQAHQDREFTSFRADVGDKLDRLDGKMDRLIERELRDRQ